MSKLATPPALHMVDSMTDRVMIPENLSGNEGAWATIIALRPDECRAAFGGQGGPVAGYLGATGGGAVATLLNGAGSVMSVQPVGLGALASAMNASAGSWRLVRP
jgi:acyl-coenzyme A thioesterase PaaI-like protein